MSPLFPQRFCAEIANSERINSEKGADHIKEISHTAYESLSCL